MFVLRWCIFNDCACALEETLLFMVQSHYKSCVFPYGTRCCILAHPRMWIRCTNKMVMHAFTQVNSLLIIKFPHKFCTSSWQSVGYVDIFHAVFWQPRISGAPKELSFSSFFQTTFIHFPELPYSWWQLKFVNGNKMWICSNNPPPPN